VSLLARIRGGEALGDDPLRVRDWLRYWRWRFRVWAVLPGDRFEDFMREVDYRIAEVRHDYVIAERRTREAAYRGLPWERVRVARPLPPEWWPA
jgi:hypothetical protein